MFKVIFGYLEIEGQPGLCETVSKQNSPKAGGVTQRNRTLLTTYKALGLIPNTPKFVPDILPTAFYTLDKTVQVKAKLWGSG